MTFLIAKIMSCFFLIFFAALSLGDNKSRDLFGKRAKYGTFDGGPQSSHLVC